MTVATKTQEELSAAYVAAAKLAEALRDYNQGTNSPSVQLGRYTVAEVDALVDDASDAIDALIDAG